MNKASEPRLASARKSRHVGKTRKITYLYRDAGNYKFWGEFCVLGELSSASGAVQTRRIFRRSNFGRSRFKSGSLSRSLFHGSAGFIETYLSLPLAQARR